MQRDGSDMRPLGVTGILPDWQPGVIPPGSVRVLLPVIFENHDGGVRPPPLTATPGPSATPRPTATPKPTATRPTLPTVRNGNFEQGANGAWEESSSNFGGQGSLISQPGATIDPRSGSWLAWLGGADDELSTLSQSFTIPNGTPIYLIYYYQIRSAETAGCDFDVAAVLVDSIFEDEFGLCADSSTTGWQKGSVNMHSVVSSWMTFHFKQPHKAPEMNGRNRR